MKPLHIAMIAALSAFIAFVTASMVAAPHINTPTPRMQTESVFDRVMRTRTIRCGYISYQPYLVKDANTGAISGPAYEYMQAIANELGVKLEWSEEVGWGNFQEGLNASRYDMMCVPVWQSGQRAQVSLLTRPLYYNALYAVAKEDDRRFDGTIETANSSNVKVAVIDGDVTQTIRQLRFPVAQELALPQAADAAQILLSIATGKADIGFEAPQNLQRFNEGNAVKLKTIGGGVPIRFSGNSLAIRLGEFQFKAMLDAVIETVNNNGIAQSIVKKFGSGFAVIAPNYDALPTP